MRTPLAILALALLAACAARELEPELVERPHFVSEDGSYALELPLGWRRDGNALTRDGWEFQTITFNAGPVLADSDPQAVDASAPELLQAMREQLESQPGVTVLACLPATFDGLAGFRLHFRRSEPPAPDAPPEVEPAPPREMLICGAISGQTLFAFSYEAEAGADFGRDLDAFERMLASFDHLTPP
jgi:hypothetical protein